MTTPARADAVSTTGPGPVSSSPQSFPRLEKYELIEEIGHGGMATVYRARDPRLGRDVAVKIIHKHLRENTEVARRFLAEARAAAKLRHPGIVEVFDVSTEDDSERYLVVELLRGTTLRKVLQQHPEMPAEIGAAIVLQLCEALEHAHESGIIHRDVKPENVLVELPTDRAAHSNRTSAPESGGAEEGKDGKRDSGGAGHPSDRGSERKKIGRLAEQGVVIKLTDFGIAKILDAQGLTSTGQVLGSPAHMAPEQIEGGEVDPRTDVFALGVLLYECLVGHLPFEGKNPAQVLRRVLDGIFTQADRERATVGGRWAKIVAAALARDTENRTADPGALGEQIQDELAALGIDDARAEVTAFFADPERYSADLKGRLVPRLVARGEAARKNGNVQGAAADFNRALALTPSDLTILKRVTALTGAASRREMFKRASMIAGGSVVLGFVAFVAARQFKSHALTGPGPAVSEAPAVTAPPAEVSSVIGPEPRGSAKGAPSAAASADKPKHVPLATTTTAAAAVTSNPVPSVRKVKFTIEPAGATLTLNGSPTNWLGATLDLSVGSSTVVVDPPSGSNCCKALRSSIEVKAAPSERPEEVQDVQLRLERNPATARLVGAPPAAECSCTGLGVVFRAASQRVPLPRVEWSGPCIFSDPSNAEVKPISSTVTLRAGEDTAIAWPKPKQ